MYDNVTGDNLATPEQIFIALGLIILISVSWTKLKEPRGKSRSTNNKLPFYKTVFSSSYSTNTTADKATADLTDNLNRNVMLDHIKFVEKGIRPKDKKYLEYKKIQKHLKSLYAYRKWKHNRIRFLG